MNKKPNKSAAALAELVEVLCVFEFSGGKWCHRHTATNERGYIDGVRANEWPEHVTTEEVRRKDKAPYRANLPNRAVTAWSMAGGVGLVRLTCSAPWLSPFVGETLRDVPNWWRLIEDGHTLVERTASEAARVLAGALATSAPALGG